MEIQRDSRIKACRDLVDNVDGYKLANKLQLGMPEETLYTLLSLAYGDPFSGELILDTLEKCGARRTDWHYWYVRWVVWVEAVSSAENS